MWSEAHLSCPRCGQPGTLPVLESLNLTRHPELRALVVERRLHRQPCPGCGATWVLDRPLLFTDFDGGWWIHTLPETERAAVATHEADAQRLFAAQFGPGPGGCGAEPGATLGPTAPPAARALGAGLRLRVVFGLEELREKVVGTALDDRVIEALKIEVFATEPDLLRAGGRRLVLEHVDETTLYFHLFGDPPAELLGEVRVPRVRYEHLAVQPLAAHYPRLFAGPGVSALRYREDA